MTSPLLALFIRSLREDSRLKFTYFARAGLVLVLLLFLFTTQTTMGWMNAPGMQFFGTVVGVDLCFVVLAGVSYFASAISEEKEEMTLGLLRMTNLNPLSILLGKSTSRLCTAVLLFAAQIPFTLLAITLGGVSLVQICAAYVAIGAFLVFVSNLALLASVLCRRTGTAAVLTGLALLFFFAIVPVANWFAQMPVRFGLVKESNSWTAAFDAFAEFAKGASPFWRVTKILSTGFAESAFSFQVWSNLAMGLVFFLLAWVVFEKFCGEQKESAPGRVGVARARGRWRALSPGRAWTAALAWKDFYFTTGGKLWILIKLAIYGTPLIAMRCWPAELGGPPSWKNFGAGMFWFMLLFIFVELAFAAASIFRNEHQGQTLSSLAMLPQGIRRVAYEKLFGVLPSLAAAGFYLALSLPLVAGPFTNDMTELLGKNYALETILGFVFTGAQCVFFLHLVAMLSLYVKRGALPLAVGIHIVLLIFLSTASIVVSRNSVASTIFLLVLTLLTTAILHYHTGSRLETLAAEE